MSTDLNDLRLAQFLQIIKDSYKSIDIRSIFAKANNDWVCIFLKIRCTEQDETILEKNHIVKKPTF